MLQEIDDLFLIPLNYNKITTFTPSPKTYNERMKMRNKQICRLLCLLAYDSLFLSYLFLLNPINGRLK